MGYEYQVSPFEFWEFPDFTKEQAKEYFEWYTGQIGGRIEYLREYMAREGYGMGFDYSPESLIPLWRWYEGKVEVVEKTEEELAEERKKTPGWLHEYIKKDRLSYETIGICLDVAAYFAEAVIRGGGGKLKWGYFTKPKNRAGVNRPVVLGFKANIDLDPRVVVHNCTKHDLKEKRETRLYDLYHTWMKYVE